MPRHARIVVPGLAYHVTQRGSRKSRVFFTDEDRIEYLELMKTYAPKHGVEVLAYCLMTNHVHHILVPSKEDSLHKLLRPLHSQYARRINIRNDWIGHLWQNRFFSCALDLNHLIRAIIYVELNPVRAGMVTQAEDYQWSSAPTRVFKLENSLLALHSPLLKNVHGSDEDWSKRLLEGVNSTDANTIREKTRQGLPFGSQEFVIELETITGRSLRMKRAGRPSKSGSVPN